MKSSATRSATLVAAALALAACGHPAGNVQGDPGNLVVPVKATVLRAISITIKPEFSSPDYRTQEVVNVYRAVDVDLLEIRLFKVGAGVESLVASANLQQGDLTSSVSFTGLAPDSRYHITAKAYTGPVGARTLISQEFTRFIDVAADDILAPIVISIQLDDRPFSGTASTNLDIQDGLLKPGASESIAVVPASAPTPEPSPTPAPALIAQYSTSGTLSTLVTLLSVTYGVPGNYGLTLDHRDAGGGMFHYFLRFSTVEVDLGEAWPAAMQNITAPGAGTLALSFVGQAPIEPVTYPVTETVTIVAQP